MIEHVPSCLKKTGAGIRGRRLVLKELGEIPDVHLVLKEKTGADRAGGPVF